MMSSGNGTKEWKANMQFATQSMPYPTIGLALSNLGFLSSIIRCHVDELEYKIHMRTMLHKNISTTHPSKNKSGHGLFPLFFQQYCQHLPLPPLGAPNSLGHSR